MSALDGQIWMKLVKFGTDLQKDQWFDQKMDVQSQIYKEKWPDFEPKMIKITKKCHFLIPTDL